MSMEETISNFVEKWSLDSGSKDMLATLPEGLLNDVVQTFDPPPDTRNMNAKLKTFVRSKENGPGKGQQRDQGQAWASPRASPRASAAPDHSGIGEFATTWGLDAKAVQMLKELPQDVCARIVADFAPPADTQNVNAKLQAFVRNRMKDLGPGQHQGHDAVSGFVGHWGVDAASEAMLRSLPPAHLETVLMEFDAPPDTRNPSGKLTSFVKSICSGNGGKSMKGGGGYGYASDKGKGGFAGGGYGHHRQQPQDPVAGFVAHWGLDQAAEQALRAIPFSFQESVMAEFSPPPDTMNPSGKLTSFIRAKMTSDGWSGGKGAGHGGKGAGPAMKRPRADPVASFVMHWQLDTEADQLLRSLSWDIQEGVMRDFQPPPNTMNYSGKFVSFVKKMLGDPAGGGGATAKGGGRKGHDPEGGLGGFEHRWPSKGKGKGQKSNGDPVGNFVWQWGLDPSSDNLLRSLSEDVLEQVLAGFQPQADTRNPNAKLATWIRSLRSPDGAPPAKKGKHE